MSETNRQAQLRHGLTQYIGAMLSNKDLNQKAAVQLTVAALVEEAVKLCKTDDGIDMFRAKPILRATEYIFNEDFKKMAREAQKQGLDDQILPGLKATFDKNMKFIRKAIDTAE